MEDGEKDLMKASELIKELEKAIEEHGDLNVEQGSDFGSEVESIYFDGDVFLTMPD